ncbi:hypothetical protein D1007_48986 [Hordeum vulgare]|nr:hypothetical protein D1007_48986 [Hordeum vulgare]
MTEIFEDILAKKEDKCVKRYGMKEEKKAEMFNIWMAATEKEINLKEKSTRLEEKMVELATILDDTKMLAMRKDELDVEQRCRAPRPF